MNKDTKKNRNFLKTFHTGAIGNFIGLIIVAPLTWYPMISINHYCRIQALVALIITVFFHIRKKKIGRISLSTFRKASIGNLMAVIVTSSIFPPWDWLIDVRICWSFQMAVALVSIVAFWVLMIIVKNVKAIRYR